MDTTRCRLWSTHGYPFHWTTQRSNQPTACATVRSATGSRIDRTQGRDEIISSALGVTLAETRPGVATEISAPQTRISSAASSTSIDDSTRTTTGRRSNGAAEPDHRRRLLGTRCGVALGKTTSPPFSDLVEEHSGFRLGGALGCAEAAGT